METEDSGEERIRKIKRIIRECRYGIHDISRVELDAVHQLPRFNMPLELGLFLGAQEYGGTGISATGPRENYVAINLRLRLNLAGLSGYTLSCE